MACAPGAAAAPPLPRCWLAGGAASPPRHRGLVGASAPPPHHGLAPPGEVAPPEGARSWCWAPPAATSSTPSSSPPSIDLGFGVFFGEEGHGQERSAAREVQEKLDARACLSHYEKTDMVNIGN